MELDRTLPRVGSDPDIKMNVQNLELPFFYSVGQSSKLLTFGCFYESRLNRQYFQNERRYKQTQKNVNYEGSPISPQTAEITSHFYTPCTVCNFHMARRAAITSQTKSQTDSDSYCFVVESQTTWAWQRANPRYLVMRLPDKKLAPTACSSWTSPDY